MSKTKGSSKANWIDVDRRIRDRQKFWQGEQVKELDAQLSSLPDLAEQVEIIDIEQPAILSRQEEQADPVEDEAGVADGPTEHPAAEEAATN